MTLNTRTLFLGGFLICAGGLGFAYLMELGLGLEPCPMCIFQRVAMFIAGLVFMTGAVHGPTGIGRWIYALLAGLASVAGAAIAGRHVWLQSLPPDQVPACGPPLDYMLDILPFTEVLRVVLRGDANCAKIDAAWLGLSLPAWTMVAFVGITLYALLIPIAHRFPKQMP